MATDGRCAVRTALNAADRNDCIRRACKSVSPVNYDQRRCLSGDHAERVIGAHTDDGAEPGDQRMRQRLSPLKSFVPPLRQSAPPSPVANESIAVERSYSLFLGPPQRLAQAWSLNRQIACVRYNDY
jgi:hypothetical protein